jgi:malate dehydrogenase (oxaloacetate-decarboxylating)(NADP+)
VPPRHGRDLLNDPIRNRGTGFDDDERHRLKLRGLLPPGIETIEQQAERVFLNCDRKSCNLERYIFLMALQDRNETLFYRSILERLRDYLPLIYTPTVGEAAQQYAHIFRRPRGLYVTAQDRGHVEEVLRNWPHSDVRVIVVTDGERILGLGDQGANGMTIPIGKLALYTAAGGIPPESTLPILIDVGTDNEELRSDALYLGLRRPRTRGDKYLELLDEFVEAVQSVFPSALIQFEDFATANAFSLLERYRSRVCSFNDDIQGTAAVTLAGLLAALRVTGGRLVDKTLLFVGAGSANTGVANLVVDTMAAEGVAPIEARKRCWFMDTKGLIVEGRGRFRAHSAPFAHSHEGISDLVEAIEQLRPDALIGATGFPGAFPRPAIEAMARIVDRPVVFALSNPTSKAEATAQDVYAWTQGRALFASGSPFDAVELDGETHVPGQANNVYIFPGVGLAAVACRIRYITDEMFRAAAGAVAGSVSAELLGQGTLFPPLERIRDVSAAIATVVAEVAFERGLCGIERPDDVEARVREQMYWPDYRDDR